jgi:hypothetical protein
LENFIISSRRYHMIGQHQWLAGSGAAGAAQSLTSGADIHTFLICEKCKVIMSGFRVEADTVSSGAIVVEFDRVPNNDGTREAAFAQLSIPTAVVTGKVYYEIPTTEKLLYPGDQVVVQVATAAAGGGAAGTGYPFLVVEPLPERPANITAMVAG